MAFALKSTGNTVARSLATILTGKTRFDKTSLTDKVSGLMAALGFGCLGAFSGLALVRMTLPPSKAPDQELFHGTNEEFWNPGLPEKGMHFNVEKGGFFFVTKEDKKVAGKYATNELASMNRSDGVSFGLQAPQGAPAVLVVRPVDSDVPCVKKGVLGWCYVVSGTELEVVDVIKGLEEVKKFNA